MFNPDTSYDVDIMYGSEDVFNGGGHATLNSEVLHWLGRSGKQGIDWMILDRAPDDGFRGETFQFMKKGDAVLFKLTWGGV